MKIKSKKSNMLSTIIAIILIILSISAGIYYYHANKNDNPNPKYKIGQVIDTFNGVAVHHNGKISHVSGRNLTDDGYNLGLKYQCVEFVKRYYYEALNHKMPDSYGNAKDFFDTRLKDGEKNIKRDLTQYTNPSRTKPQVSDLLIYSSTLSNRYGHVAIISAVTDKDIEIIQQNAGAFGNTRERFGLVNESGLWRIENTRILGWLRKE